ncbi:putative Cytochrome c552 [Magnetofaba australis IT-1]|uniref:Putative Cytochrome c552 n=2 Tax=Magnetofaba TaxID=1472292 RepID=A0A1Y2K0D3_9PROT|nr:putative Cytochrome c552 [Magnetofaba australis IT-1]
MKENFGLWQEWNASQHGQNGINCLDCHQAQKNDPDAFTHKGQLISILVTPKDCARCHPTEVKEQQRSHHATAGQILNSLDNLLGEVIGGPAAVVVGCRQCHGGKVEIDAKGRPTMDTWPNTGIGRINPDGSWGSCAACHGRHTFSRAQARTPDTCGKCHIGPDHPQLEVYNESKHGILYRAQTETDPSKLNLHSDKWVAGVDNPIAPTCSTCHMSEAQGLAKTHDVGERISWNLRSPVSNKINLVRLDNGKSFDVPEGKPVPKVGSQARGAKVIEVLTWENRREMMETVCYACHGEKFVTGHYKQLDDFVELYNEKFAKPVKAIMGELKKMGKITPSPFDDKIEWIWWEIWHHEGRVARHGAAMMGPDYAWWHGLYEVAQHTYFKFIPELEHIVGKEEAKRLVKKHFTHPGHDWYFNGMNKDALKKIKAEYEKRYGKGSVQ